MNTIIGELGKSHKFVDLIHEIENKKSPIAISGLTDVGMTQIISGIHEFAKKNVCIVTYNEIQARKIVEDIKNFTERVVFFPKKDIVAYDYIAESKDLPYERIETLNQIVSKKKFIVVTTIEAVMQKLPSKETLYKNILEFKVGKSYSIEELKKKLIQLGYTRYDLIEGRGQFSIRGGIVDISTNENTGIRIEFWGDEIDSIRSFHILSQRSIQNLEKITIFPAHEYVLEKTKEEVCKKIEKIKVDTDLQEEKLKEDIEQIKVGDYISKIDKYFNCFYEKEESLLNYLSKQTCIIFDEISKIEQREKNIFQDQENLERALLEKEKWIPQAISNKSSLEQIKENLDNQFIYMEKLDTKPKFQIETYFMNYREINYYKSEIENFLKDLKKLISEKKKVTVFVNSKEKAKKLKTILEKEEIICKIEENLDKTIIVKSTESIVTITVGTVSSGFENITLNQVIISADEKLKDIIQRIYGEKITNKYLKINILK